MGLFKKLFKHTEKKAEKDHSFVIDIARLITNNDERVMRHFDCTNDPWAALVDQLEEEGYLFSFDYKDDLKNFLWAISQIKTYSLIDIDISALDLDPKGDIESWGEQINLALNEKSYLSFIDLGSDSYELIIVTGDVYRKISDIAEENGHIIEAF